MAKKDLEINYMPATEMLRRFRDKSLSPVEAMEAMIARAEETQPKINAFTYTFFDKALAQAKKAEEKYAKGRKTGALEGLAIGIKDENHLLGVSIDDTEGTPTSFGVRGAEIIAKKNSPNNERILKAGGIPIFKTATPEFSITPVTWGKLWGVTRNPWNTDYTPGGSTGGGSASLAAGSTTLAMGSDIGGSIRIPASTCGLVGFKPPHGRNPDDLPFNLDPYCHTGPLARNVDDAILLQSVIAGQHPMDMTSLKEKVRYRTDFEDIKGWRIAYSIDLGHYEVDKEVRKNTLEALTVFKSLGAEIVEVDLGWTKKAYEASSAHIALIFGAQVALELKRRRKDLSPYAIDFGERGKKVNALENIPAMDVEGEMFVGFMKAMQGFDAFVCPTTALPAVKADHDHSIHKVLINGKDPGLEPPMLNWVMTSPFNCLNRLPVMAVPSGLSSKGVPTGIQIVGKPYDDLAAIQAAKVYETARGRWFEDKKKRPKI